MKNNWRLCLSWVLVIAPLFVGVVLSAALGSIWPMVITLLLHLPAYEIARDLRKDHFKLNRLKRK